MDITDVKSALDAHGKAIDSAIEKYEGQLKEQGKASDDIRNEVKALAAKFEDEVRDLAQKMDKVGESTVVAMSAGKEFVKSEQFKALARGDIQRARIEVKNTVVSDSTNTFPDQRPGIIPGNFEPVTIRQVIPSIPVTSNMVNSLRELSWTNDASEVAQNTAKPESDITFEQYNVPITTVAHFIKVSNQLLADAPAVASYIDTRLRDGLAQRVDRQLLLGDGNAPNLSGLTDVGNFTAYSPLSGANLVESINRAKYLLWATGNAPDTVIVNPADWSVMELARESSGSGTYLYGAPGTFAGTTPFGVQVVMSNHMAAGSFLIGALRSSTVIYARQGAVVEMGYVNTDFTSNLVTIRAEERLGLGVDRPAAILYGDITAS